MQARETTWPVKQRDIHNHHMDSTAWDRFNYRDGDIVIGTYAKSGTTWTQQIVSQLVFNGAEGIDVATLSPAEIRAYEARAMAELGPDCAAWLEMGRSLKAAA